MKHTFNTDYPSIDFLREKAKKRIPGFAFDYLEGGCNEEVNLRKNTSELREVELVPDYLSRHNKSELKTELFGHTYDAPFGIAPIGLQGLIWPKTPEILARAAFKHNIPFILSTVSTASIETISELTEGRAWFQLYHPRENSLRDKIIQRAEAARCPVLVILCDVPSFGFRYNDIRNGLGMPPKMSARNFMQIMSKPEWALRTLWHGPPGFANLKPYMPENINLKQLGLFMNETFSGRLNEEKIKPIRDMWKGKLVLKGVASEADTERAIKLGLDGIIISNHGGRQLDAGQSTIKLLPDIKAKYGNKIRVMIDSGLRSGPDVARALASGADFTFMGRSFMYGTAALGDQGGDHTISILKVQLQQVMEQLCCEKVKDFPRFLKI
jgi:L-lactate dehydrogenase (cytochrome)